MFVQPSTAEFPNRTVDDVADLADVRGAFASWLAGHRVDPVASADLAVVLSELGANAVRASGEASGPAQVAASLHQIEHSTDVEIRVEVVNEIPPGTPSPGDHEWDLDDPLRTGGRGLLLVSAFVDDVDVVVDAGHLRVHCVRRVTVG